MKLKDITVLCSLMFFGGCLCACASDNSWIVAEQLDDVRGLTYCSFKESKKGNYSYCSEKIKNIAISVSFDKEVPISHHPQSMSIDYIYRYIANYYESLDSQIEEFKYDVYFLPSKAWNEIPRKNYLYLHVKFFTINEKEIICSIFLSRNGKSNIDSFLIDISEKDYHNSFKRGLDNIIYRIDREFILRKGM